MEDKSPAGCFFAKNLNELNQLSSDEWNVTAYRSVNGGGTGQEFTDNLKRSGDSPGNKWYDCWSGQTWIQAEFIPNARIKFMQLKSANDCPERDPYTITVDVKDEEGSEFKNIGKFTNIVWGKRYQLLDFNIDSGTEVKYLRITINENRSLIYDGHWGSGTQLAEVLFFI